MITARENQSLLDLALIAGGTVECVFELAEENNIGITDKVWPAQDISTDNVVTISRDILDYYKRFKLSPATINTAAMFSGIGFMQIGVDFKVS